MFEAIRAEYYPIVLAHNVIAKQVDLETYFTVEDALEEQIFPGAESLRHFSTPSSRRDHSAELGALQRQGHQDAVVFYTGDNPIGYAAGRMLGAAEFLMDVTGILPAFQNKGLYTAFLHHHMKYLRALGYERVMSHHSPTNRAVLIAKLKAGFIITGTTFRENAGASVQLTFFLHEDRYTGFQDVFSLQPHPYTPSG